MRILHVIHDFLPRHRAGSEIYASELARAQSGRHDVFVLAAEYDPATAHGTLRWRMHEGLTVIELVNNWEFETFAETYSSERINAQLQHVLDATAPDVLHVHNLLNLSLDLPAMAHARGIRVVATLHDFTLVCVSGGQRVHVAENHICTTIDADRCSRCFAESPFASQLAAGRLTRGKTGRAAAQAAKTVRRLLPRFADAAAHQLRAGSEPSDIRRRLAYARHVFETIDLFVAPSASLRDEFVALGIAPDRIALSDYGFAPVAALPRQPRTADRPLRIGFVGTLVWHKGAHLLLEALRGINGRAELHVHGDTGVFPVYMDRLRHSTRGVAVTFHGPFDRGAMPEVYANLDVVVVPSLWPENSPLVIHEAFMHGVPVIAARTGGIEGLIEHDVNGLLYEPFSVEELRNALQRVIDDPALLDGFAAAAPAVKSIEDDAREWDARYESACSSGRSRRTVAV